MGGGHVGGAVSLQSIASVSREGLWLSSSSWPACGFYRLDHAPHRCYPLTNGRISRAAGGWGRGGVAQHIDSVLFKWKLGQQNKNYSQQIGCSSSNSSPA